MEDYKSFEIFKIAVNIYANAVSTCMIRHDMKVFTETINTVFDTYTQNKQKLEAKGQTSFVKDAVCGQGSVK